MKKFRSKLFVVVVVVLFSGVSAFAADCLVTSINQQGDSWEIVVSLDGLPEGDVFMSGWPQKVGTNFEINANGNNTATISVESWPAGEYFYFSYGRGIWSPTHKGWMNPDCSDYEYKSEDGESFRVKLGIKPPEPPVDFKIMGTMVTVRSLLLTSCSVPTNAKTEDKMVLGVEDLDNGKYRLYFSFDGLVGSQRFFVSEKAPDEGWRVKAIQKIKKCQVVDIDWNYPGQKIHFSWYAQTGDDQHWADAEGSGSKFATCLDEGGYKQFCLDPAEVVADLVGNH